MIATDFIWLTEAFVANGGTFTYLLELLTTTEQAHNEIQTRIRPLINAQQSSGAVYVPHSELIKLLRKVSSDIRMGYDTRKVWSGVEDAIRRNERFREADVASDLAQAISAQLTCFSDVYERFVKSYSDDDTFGLIEAGNDLNQTLKSVRLTATLARDALASDAAAGDGEAELEVRFASHPDLADLAAKLSALANVYQKLCELAKISTATSPLRIAKLELGCWLVKVIGSLPVIGAMTRLVEGVASYCYRNYTTEGRISMLPRKAETVQSILNLKTALDEQGIDTTSIAADIESASVMIAKELNTLLGGETGIRINAQLIGTLPNAAQRRTLGGQALIENASSLDSPTNDAESGQ